MAKIVNSIEGAIAALQRETFQHVFLDYDLGFGRTTEEIARYLVKLQFSGAIVIHSSNPFGSTVLEKTLKDGGINNLQAVSFDLLGVFRENVRSTSKADLRDIDGTE